ncbi:MAG: iron-containing alcohol dehydrogenase [Candidatus Micrarchaeota archaeon]
MEFTFYNPTKLVFGKGRIAELGAEMKARKARKALLVAGGGSARKNKVYAQVVASLKGAGIRWVESWGVKPNPSLEKVREMIALARREKVDCVLAVGGGSVIDASKAVAAGYFLEDIWKAFEGSEAVKKALPLYTVLTLSATASEMDPYAVISNEREKKKWAIGSDVLCPVVSIVDPSVQSTLPWHQTVYGAIDGLSHVMDYYFLGNEEETTLAVDEALMRTIITQTRALRKNRRNAAARANLAWAITLALNGTSGAGLRGGDWACHSIEHAISALHPEIAHGAGLAAVFPAWISFSHDRNPIFKRWAKQVWNSTSVEAAVAKMKKQYSAWGAPVSLHELGVKRGEIPLVAAKAVEKSGSCGVLKRLSEKDVEGILKLAF